MMTFQLRRFNFGKEDVVTTVTNEHQIIDKWVGCVAKDLHPDLRVIVGWALETQSNYPNGIATLQLCVGSRCIIIQLLHLKCIPASLRNFLARRNTIYVGMVEEKEEKELFEKYGLLCKKTADIRALGMEFIPSNFLGKSRIQTLANCIPQLKFKVPKPDNTLHSNWEALNLEPNQLEHACFDAYACYHIGVELSKRLSWGEGSVYAKHFFSFNQ